MKNLFVLIAFLGFFYNFSFTQDACNIQHKNKIRILGDSWAHFPYLYKAYDSAFVKFGLPEYHGTGRNTALISMNSEAFLHPLAKFVWQPMMELDARDGVDLMIMSMLGNDIAFKIHKGDPLSVLDAPLHQARLNLDTIIDFIHEKNPNVQILWMCYDFPNFVDPIIDFPWNPYRDIWEGRGSPEPFELNPFINYMAHLQDSILQLWNRPYVHFVNNVGLMQWMFGQTTPLRAWPFGTYPPKTVPFPGGDERYPSPYPAMGLGGLDTYHLGPQGYTYLAEYQMRKFFIPQLKKEVDTTIYSEGGILDGWVSETGMTGTGEVKIGHQGNGVKLKGIFTFNTAVLDPNKTIEKVAFYVRRKSGSYKSYKFETNFPTNFSVDIKSGTFGNVGIEASDYNATASATDVACFAGRPIDVDYSLRMDIIADYLSYINTNGYTQFRLEVLVDSATSESIINFFNGDTTEFEGPYLDVYYGEDNVATSIVNKNTIDFNVFPNPTSDLLYVSFSNSFQPITYQIIQSNGSVVQNKNINNTKELIIDVKHLATGIYQLQLTDKNNDISVNSFVKE
ncbi:MAG: T9SS type A sorting domain-containing protein [Chitinophagales bacterium]|nr:T9SS type A sorting domain-containing protein [Chitinophagales bacterium]